MLIFKLAFSRTYTAVHLAFTMTVIIIGQKWQILYFASMKYCWSEKNHIERVVRLTCHFNKIIILVIKPLCIVKVNVIAFNNMLYLHRLVLGLKLCQLCWLGSYIDFVTDDVVLVFTLTLLQMVMSKESEEVLDLGQSYCLKRVKKFWTWAFIV